VPITVAILLALFWVQSRGTARVATFFGPLMMVWFAAIAAGGLWHIGQHPTVLFAFNPWHGISFLIHHGIIAFFTLGAVFLVVTGAEALYADLGHFGRAPIRLAWLTVVLPALTLNYLGQGALVLADPKALDNPFFLLYPHWALLPMVVLATIATVIASQAVITGAYRAVEFIKKNIKLESSEKASVSDSKKVVAICTRYAQAGMFNIFLTIFFITLAAAFVDEYFFIAYLIGIALSGLFQAIFMANAGGAWDNAKKIVETELRAKGTPLHDATIVGDTVGDPFKDTSSVAMNPIIKFCTLFGLLAVELALTMGRGNRSILAGVFFLVAVVFIYRSFYGMRIVETAKE